MKRIVGIMIAFAILLSTFFSVGAFAEDNEIKEAEKLISENLYNKTKKTTLSAFQQANRVTGFDYKLANDDDIPEDATEVKYNPQSKEFAAVVTILYKYTMDHREYYGSQVHTYTGTLNGKTVNVKTDDLLKETMFNKQITEFWKEWDKHCKDLEKEKTSQTMSANDSTTFTGMESVVEFDLETIIKNLDRYEETSNGIDKVGYFPRIKVFAIILSNNKNTLHVYEDFPENVYNKLINSNNSYSYYWNNIVGKYTCKDYKITQE